MTLVDYSKMTEAGASGGGAHVRDYIALLKPRVMSLVIFTALVGMMAAPGTMHPFVGFTAILCIAIGAGASGALNMWYDADIDRIMSRTQTRPIPSGAITPQEALTFGMTLSVGSVLVLGMLVNWAAAALLAFTIFFYAVIYTMWLKRSTPQNIVIGGAAGAFPPMVGWAAVTGTISLESIILFSIIFFWTPPHFWALALFKSKDYQAAGVPMMPVVHGEKVTRQQIWIYSLVLAPIGLSPAFIGLGGTLYAVISTALTLQFLRLAWLVYKDVDARDNQKAAKKLFGFSIIYLFVLFAIILVEKMTGLDAILGAWMS